ncbi:MAG TPA: sigma-70 family RNA polymerase sigma factor [Mycobacteriales bacterium]|nr:sigma-70 family RNA polymerase sigma factor [Mycobacteriales bacterium]
MLAATVRVTRDLDLAEECVQDAFARALTAWTADGVPRNPGAWLTRTARNRAVDLLRREATLRSKLPLLVTDDVAPTQDTDVFPDDRLRLVFTCCHPALAPEAQVALALRLLCGLSTAEVARAFLVSEPTMAARITRAKKKIAQAGIPYRVPSAQELPDRVDAVLAALHLLFTTGHTAPVGDALVRHDLVGRALDLTRMLHGLLPLPEVTGLLALELLTDARRATRVAGDGRLLLLEEQDRSLWDREQIEEGLALVREALARGPVGRYAVQAAIAAVHADATTWEETDWREVVALYGVLAQRWPSPVVQLNRAAAIAHADGPEAGLAALEPLLSEPALAGYGYLPAARAELLRRLGRYGEARSAYEEALLLTENAVERRFLAERLAGL